MRLDGSLYVKLVEEWQRAQLKFETAPVSGEEKGRTPFFQYIHDRGEEEHGSRDLSRVYAVSPKDTLIPELIKSNPKRKIRVIDLGAGSAQYTDLLREVFSGQIKVFSTGISKRAAKNTRRHSRLEKLHRNDLKWRSIEELNDQPEFDLILSSYGELFYGTKPNPYSADPEKEAPEKLYAKLRKVMTKLNDGGIACFGPAIDLDAIKKVLEQLSLELGFQYSFRTSPDNESSWASHKVLIRKNGNLDFAERNF